MQEIIDYFESINPILAAFYSTLFTWCLKAAGAALVFFFKGMNRAVLDGMLGFTGGVMVAASFWSLLAPGIEMSEGEGFVKEKHPTKPGNYLAFYENLYKAIREHAPLSVLPEEARNVIRIIEAAYQSSREKQVIVLRG